MNLESAIPDIEAGPWHAPNRVARVCMTSSAGESSEGVNRA